ncbi:hypothetical protein CALVIDRAFT_569571 [Calocera viscosa TUFC12733]|uniref:Uncharacterized protein n=1 Tax=Calocera viscosa (strain TUFC12733) TaxID=1330018 RepID=A0A167FU89_CALVF|nr:hypothetical protein CALVIDRAFT_569571 [Calocera viscosa TUFC12733]
MIAQRLRHDLTSQPHQYFIFLTTIIARLFPNYQYQRPSGAAVVGLNSTARIYHEQKQLVFTLSDGKHGQKDPDRILALFLLFCVYRLHNMESMIMQKTKVTLKDFKDKVHSKKGLSIPLFCNLGLYEVIGTDARLLSNGAPKKNNFVFKSEAKLIEQWKTVQERWRAQDYEGVATDMFGSNAVEQFKAQNMLLPPMIHTIPPIPFKEVSAEMAKGKKR